MDITYIILIAVSALLSAILGGILARKKGYSGGYFWLGLFFNLIGFVYIAGLPQKAQAPAAAKPAPSGSPAPVPAAKPAAAAPRPAKAAADAELVAVLTAAVAAMLDTTADGLVVRSYRRLKSGKPAWNKSGRFEQLNRY